MSQTATNIGGALHLVDYSEANAVRTHESTRWDIQCGIDARTML